MAYVGMVQQIFGEVFHRANLMPSMFALCAISMGMAAYPELAHRGTLGDALDFPYRLAVVPRRQRAAFGHRAARLEQIWTFVVLQAVGMACFACRCPISAPWRWSPWVRSPASGVPAGLCVDLQRSAGGRLHRPAVQRHHRAPGGRRAVLRLGESRVRAACGKRPAVSGLTMSSSEPMDLKVRLPA